MPWKQRVSADPWGTAGFAVVVGHLLIDMAVRGPRPEIFLINGIMIALTRMGPRSRQAASVLFPFWIMGVLYVYQSVLDPLRQVVHVADIHQWDRALFGVGTGTERLALPMFLESHTHWFMDLLTGAAYLVYFPEPVVIAAWLAFHDPDRARRMGWEFLLMVTVAFTIFVIFPAAPPWYVAAFGDGPVIAGFPPSAAGALRVDEWLGIALFEPIYTLNSNVFAAMPSLHVAFPSLAVAVTWGRGTAWRLATGGFALLVAIAAVYLQHHWVLDVLAGAALAFAVHIFASRTGILRPLVNWASETRTNVE